MINHYLPITSAQVREPL